MDDNEFLAVHETLCRFFAAFDNKDWTSMVDCLDEEIFIDYSSSGRETPTKMTGKDFVEKRESAVDSLSKQHNFSNLFISSHADKENINASCNYLILRFEVANTDESSNFFHSCGKYEFELSKRNGIYKISAIRQFKLQSWGNKKLHGGSNKN